MWEHIEDLKKFVTALEAAPAHCYSQSHPLFHRLADRLEELLPQEKRVEITRASHIMHEDNEVEYNEIVNAFLGYESNASEKKGKVRRRPRLASGRISPSITLTFRR